MSVSLKMDKIEYRAVIKLLVKEGLTPNEVHSKFIKVYGDSSASFSTIKKRAAEFKRCRTSLEDDLREGHIWEEVLHADAENFTLTSMYAWHTCSRWYTPDCT